MESRRPAPSGVTLHAELGYLALSFGERVRERNQGGDVYSVDEVRGWLGETGWRFIDHQPLAGPQTLIVAEAI